MRTIISFYYKRPIDLPTILNMYFCQSTNPFLVYIVTATLVTAVIAFSICHMGCENNSLPNGLRGWDYCDMTFHVMSLDVWPCWCSLRTASH